MAFWQVVILLAAAAACFIVWPIFKSSGRKEFIRHDQTQADLYEEHLADLDRALENGDIDSEQYKVLKIELQRTLVTEADGLKEIDQRGGGKPLLITLALVAPILGWFFYNQWGAKPDWEIYQMMEFEREAPAQNREEFEQQTRELLLEVQTRLKQKPDNHQMRYLLAERSMAIKDYDTAIESYKTLLKAEPASPVMSIKLAQALFVREGNKVTDEVAEHTKAAISGAPFMYQALEMGGMVAFHQKDYRNAVIYWRRAKQQLDPSSRSAQALDGAIQRAAQAAVAAGQNLMADSQPAVAKTTSQKAETATDPATNDGVGFDIAVSLGDGINAAIDDTLFVYARPFGGGKMPLAIKRLKVGDLPLTVRLDNSMAMAPGMDMSSAEELEIVARISKSGSPVPQPGDWQAAKGPVKLGEIIKSHSLVINEKL